MRSSVKTPCIYIKSIDPNLDIKFHVAGYEVLDNDQPPRPVAYLVNKTGLTLLNKPGYAGFMYCGCVNYFSAFSKEINNNLGFYSLQDAIDVSVFAIDMSSKLCRFINLQETISGSIDVLVIRPNGIEWVNKKSLKV